MQDADDVVERVAEDRQPAVRARRDDAQHVGHRRREVERRQAFARHHQLTGVAQAEPERAVQPHLLLRLEQAAVAALGDEQRDLLGRVHVTMPVLGSAERTQDDERAAVEERDQPGVRAQRPLHRQRR